MTNPCTGFLMAEEWEYTGGNIQAEFGLSVTICQSQMTTRPSLSLSQGLWLSDNDDYEDDIMENEVSQLAVLR